MDPAYAIVPRTLKRMHEGTEISEGHVEKRPRLNEEQTDEQKLNELFKKIIENPEESFSADNLQGMKTNFSELKNVDKSGETYKYVYKVLTNPFFYVIIKDGLTYSKLISPYAINSNYIKMLLSNDKLASDKCKGVVIENCTKKMLNAIDDLFCNCENLIRFSKNINKQLDFLQIGDFLCSQKIQQFAVLKLKKSFHNYFDELQGLSEFNNYTNQNPDYLQKMDHLITFLNINLVTDEICADFIGKSISQVLNNDSHLPAYIEKRNEILQILRSPACQHRLFSLKINHDRLHMLMGIQISRLEIVFNGSCKEKLTSTQIIQQLLELNTEKLKKLKFSNFIVLNGENIENIVSRCPLLTSFECKVPELTTGACLSLAQLNLTSLGLVGVSLADTNDISLLLKPSLEKLNFTECYALKQEHFELISKMQNLQSLNLKFFQELHYNGDDDDYVRALHNMNHLKDLHLSYWGIGNDSLQHIAKNMPNLQKLDICGCAYIRSIGLLTLSDLPFLKKLYIEDCQVYDQAILNGEWASLQELCYSKNQFNKRTIEYLKQINPKITLIKDGWQEED